MPRKLLKASRGLYIYRKIKMKIKKQTIVKLTVVQAKQLLAGANTDNNSGCICPHTNTPSCSGPKTKCYC